MTMTKDQRLKRAETERKVELAKEFLERAISQRMAAGSWGKVTVIAIVEAGFCKEVQLDDCTVVRDLPLEKLQQIILPPLTEEQQLS